MVSLVYVSKSTLVTLRLAARPGTWPRGHEEVSLAIFLCEVACRPVVLEKRGCPRDMMIVEKVS